MEALGAYAEFDENDEDDLERDALGRIRCEFYVRVHPFERYRERKFQARYRLTRNIAAYLADAFGQSRFATSGRVNGGGLSYRDRFCLALRYYATGSFYGAIGDTQGVHKSTVCRALLDVTNYLYSVRNQYIHFPIEQNFNRISQDFYNKLGFLCIIGCVDGTHISIDCPKEHERVYVNRRWYHSINMMGVCDAFKRFIYVDSRFPGSSHDSFVLRRSSIGLEGERRNFHGYWLLGDSGYPLKPYLLTPVLHPQTDPERAYNRDHTSTRATIEPAFGILKSRFRCLDDSGGLILCEPLTAAKIIMACCVLHNIAVEHNLVIRIDNDWDGRQRPRRRRAQVAPNFVEPGYDYLENEYPVGAVVRRRLIDARFSNLN